MDSHILCGGGALAFSAIMASLLQGSKPLRAQAIIDSVPDVDRVSIRVISSFMQPPRRRQYYQAGPSCLGSCQGSCGYRGFPPSALSGRLCATDDS